MTWQPWCPEASPWGSVGASAASRRPGLSCQVCVMGMEAGSVLRSPAASLPVGSALERPERRPRPLTWRVRDRVSPRGRGAFSLCPARGAVVAGVPSGPGGPVPGPVPAASGSSAGKALTRVVATRLVTGTPACRTGSGETTPPAPPFPPAALRGGARPGASHAARPWHVSFSPTYRRLQFPPSLSPVPAALRPFASSVCPSPVS